MWLASACSVVNFLATVTLIDGGEWVCLTLHCWGPLGEEAACCG